MEKKAPIIERPEVMGSFRRRTEMGITAVGWMIWFFLFRPVVAIVLWFIGVKIFYHHIIRLGGLQGIISALKVYGWIIISVLVAERAWNLYNLLKFRNKERRVTHDRITDKEISEFLHVPAADIKSLRESENISVDFPGAGLLKFRCEIPGGKKTVEGVLARPEKPL